MGMSAQDSLLQIKKELKQSRIQNKPVLEQSRLHLRLGDFLRKRGLHNEAIEVYQQGLSLLKHGDTLHLEFASLQEGAGLSFLEADKFKMALPYLEHAEAVYESLKRYKRLAQVISSKGIAYEKLGQWSEAITFQEKSLAIFDSIRYAPGIATTQEHLGSIHEDLMELEKADRFFRLSYSYWKGSRTAREVDILNNLGDIERKQGRPRESLSLTMNALQMADSMGLLEEVESAHKDLSKTYALLGVYDSAYISLNLAQDLSEKLQEDQNTDQLNVLQTLHESRLKEGEIALLTQQNATQRAKLFVLIFAFLFFFGGSLVWYGFQLNRKKSREKQQQYKEQLLNARLIAKQQAAANLQKEVEIKVSALSRYSLHLAQKNKLLGDLSLQLRNMSDRSHLDRPKKLKELSAEIQFHLGQENEWDEFQILFSDIHPDFIHKLQQGALETFSPSELRLAMLLRLNLSSKEIASILHISPDSVRVARHRFRKKLPIQKEEDLATYLQKVE